MDKLNTKRETQIDRSSVVDIPWVKTFQQTLIVAFLHFYKHLKKLTVSVVQVLTAIYCLCLFYLAIIDKITEKVGAAVVTAVTSHKSWNGRLSTKGKLHVSNVSRRTTQ